MGQHDGKTLPILVVKDKKTKRVAATFVESKGCNAYAVKFLANFYESTGYRRACLKSDGEPSIVALKREALGKTPNLEGFPQESPPEDHQANGDIEAAVREVKKQVRAQKLALESRLQFELADDDPMVARI